MVKNPPAKSGAAGDAVLIPESGRSFGVGSDNSNILAWKIPWTGEPGGLPAMGLRVGHNRAQNVCSF